MFTSEYSCNYKLYNCTESPLQLVLDLLVHLIGRYLGLLGLKGGGADEVGRSLASLLTLTVTFNCRHPLLPLLLPSCCQQHLLTLLAKVNSHLPPSSAPNVTLVFAVKLTKFRKLDPDMIPAGEAEAEVKEARSRRRSVSVVEKVFKRTGDERAPARRWSNAVEPVVN